MKTTLEKELFSDVELVERSCGGDREAFGSIVERYQSLICALTYSACGNLQGSEDLAQVTFITAWCQLRNLQEPGKLKSWLCGIARNVANNSFRQDKRAPTVHAESLDSVAEISSGVPSPREQVISREEEAILWRSLGELPTAYREPLVLFYRQQQSVAEVAEALDLNEDAVKQRLSRGRAMLTEQVTAFVEGALRQTTPGSGFTAGVLAGLPAVATSTKIVTAGVAAAKGATMTKSAASLVSGGVWGLLGSFYFAIRANIENTKSPRERKYMVRSTWVSMVVLVVGIFIGLALRDTVRHMDQQTLDVTVAVLAFALAVYSIVAAEYKNRRRKQIQIEDGTWVAAEWMAEGKREGFSLKAGQGGSKANSYASLAFAIGIVVFVALAFSKAISGHWIRALLYLGICAVSLFRNIRAWKHQPRFDARFSTWARFAGMFGVFTLVFYNLSVFRGPPNVTTAGTIIGFNLGIVVAYGVLLWMLAWYHEKVDRLPTKP
ncbi:MAG TPA: sigma-70 family RNA polymerase sigma factor [Verrucomicrobiae bacterium]|nr:sigma-70 family RNA polymerase sigma factor [Verrucomicrobiae bacterium]